MTIDAGGPADGGAFEIVVALEALLDLLREIPTGPQSTQQQVNLADHRSHRVAQLVSGNGNKGVARGNSRHQFGGERIKACFQPVTGCDIMTEGPQARLATS
jgi:hypothetical protein